MPEDKENTTADKGKKKKLPKKLSERYLRNAGEFYLNRFPASSKHFKMVMTRKIDRSCRVHTDQNREEWLTFIEKSLIPELQSLGFLNDDLYSKALYNSLKNRGLSGKAIQSRMHQKGVERDVILALLNDEENGLNEKEAVLIFAKKKKIGRFRIHVAENSHDQDRKDLGKLARAGFSYDIAMSVLK